MGKLELNRSLLDVTNFIRFGAVLEEFEVRDAIENVFSKKPEMNTVF
jgi:hypothetical protein